VLHLRTELLDGIATEAKSQLSTFTTKGLVNLLWCYGVFGYSPPQLLPEGEFTHSAPRHLVSDSPPSRLRQHCRQAFSLSLFLTASGGSR